MQKFIKQYGEKRTGTNYLRALLADACPQAMVLMHILGDKHDAPPEALLAENGVLHPWDLTIRHPSATTFVHDERQQHFTGELADALTEALRRREVLFCVSIKNPYAWAFSMLKQHGAADTRGLKPQRLRLLETVLASECREYNRKYAAWQTLAQRMPRQTVVIRYESLLDRPADIIADICHRLQLPFRREDVRPVRNIVLPAYWDYAPSQTHHEPFDGDFYRLGRYLNKIHPRLAAVVSGEIDWALMADYGYQNVSMFQL